ncbi:unnamed protein product [Ectocarpus sp. CCAP 1310/34]|nr:unnamed protein product [Ectocarpus sp. CCAP 1310/34]
MSAQDELRALLAAEDNSNEPDNHVDTTYTALLGCNLVMGVSLDVASTV